ncbi:serine/threonine protein kinase [Roseiconus nitratireducens]|uniref:Serine/threonine protein kinase n=1 Tax=Roseiconus nitratireducens TaxID=2605748 RepID=A0A5M6D6T7_9BACT|nr:serine/threonine-protein kinase [Roseiconus nitratireducens]KAA5543238.1 serine/threonine protein kinase [Roseiconus nitratireducens]
MRNSDQLEPEVDHEFNRILEDYFDAIERDDGVDVNTFVRRHPEYEQALKSFFSDIRNVRQFIDRNRITVGAGDDRSVADPASQQLPRTAQYVGKYQLMRKLGEGGMGTVYLAFHTELEKRVAIKFLNDHRGRDTNAVKLFRKEIKAVGRFDHEHIVRAIDAGKFDELHFLVMEYIEGADLADLLKFCPPLQVSEACELARQAALGLDHAHQFGLIHRDIKPSNLMLTPAGRVKVLDLGLAQLNQPFTQSSELTVDGLRMGTLKYMPPEQFDDCHSVGATCDIYSLGVTLFELLRGKLPLSGLHRGVDCSSLQMLRNDIPDDLISLLESMTELQPSERIQSAGEVADRLLRWTDGHDLPTLFEIYRQRRRQGVVPATAVPPKVDTSTLPSNPTSTASVFSVWFAAAAASVCVISALALLFQANGLLSDPHPVAASTSATLNVRVEHGVSGNAVVPKTVLLESVITGEKLEVDLGANSVPTGDYRLLSDSWTAATPETITLTAGAVTELSLIPKLQNIQYPEIPDHAGAYVHYKAQIVPAGGDAKQAQAYHVVFRSLESEQIEGVDYRWIQAEVGNSDYCETAWLLVDTELYDKEKTLSIREGFIQAELPLEERNLTTFLGPRIAVAWSHREDPLQQVADDWGFQWPANRISMQSLLAMIFDLSHPAVPAPISNMRNLLGASTERVVEFSTFSEGLEKTSCLKIAGQPADLFDIERQVKYEIKRGRYPHEVPFGYLHVMIQDPFQTLTLERSKGGFDGVVRFPDLEQLSAESLKLTQLASPESDDITRATLPETEGDWSRHRGSVRFGRHPELTLSSTVRAGKLQNIDGRPHRWIEVAIESGLTGQLLSAERVKLLIDEQAYQQQRQFIVRKGWHELGWEVYDFQDGDSALTEQMHCWIHRRPSHPRLTVHEVLSMLFDAKFPSAGRLQDARPSLAGLIVKASANRTAKRCVIETPGSAQKSFHGYHWTVTPPETTPEKQSVTYDLYRSQEVPFGFAHVRLNVPGQFEVNLELLDCGSDLAPLTADEAALAKTARETQEKLSRAGVFQWSVAGQKRTIGRYSHYHAGDVVIDTWGPATMDRLPPLRELAIPFEQLDEQAKRWIADNQMRTWTSTNGEISQRALLDAVIDAKTVRLRYDDFSLHLVDTTRLSKQDRDYVDRQWLAHRPPEVDKRKPPMLSFFGNR